MSSAVHQNLGLLGEALKLFESPDQQAAFRQGFNIGYEVTNRADAPTPIIELVQHAVNEAVANKFVDRDEFVLGAMLAAYKVRRNKP